MEDDGGPVFAQGALRTGVCFIATLRRPAIADTETSRGCKQPNSLDPIFRTGLPISKDAGFALRIPRHVNARDARGKRPSLAVR